MYGFLLYVSEYPGKENVSILSIPKVSINSSLSSSQLLTWSRYSVDHSPSIVYNNNNDTHALEVCEILLL